MSAREIASAPEDASVCVVMTTFNGAAFVSDAVASLLSQSHRSLQLVIVDDGSTDATPEILHALAAAEPRIAFIAAPHSGIASSRNLGLALARGQFVSFLDQDDLCPPGRIARQHARLSADPELTALFGTTIMFRGANGSGPLLDAAESRPKLTMLISAALFRRALIEDIGGFDPAYQIADDFDFVLRLVESGQRIEVEDGVGVLYRRHAGQRTSDRAATRAECSRALLQSLRRRRAKGLRGPLLHPLVRAGGAP